jgi:DNA repair exonuclease SbcCD nuclease subunit
MLDFSFIHAADLHLGSPFVGLGTQDPKLAELMTSASRDALDDLVTQAIELKVAFFVIAGDVYDGDWKDTTIGLFFHGQMSRLERAGIPVFLVRGNHDAESVITKAVRSPKAIRTFDHHKVQSLELPDLKVVLHGQSFSTRAVTTDLATGYPAARPGWFNIGVLHTSCDNRPGHDNYAPCSLEELVQRGYQYWALGHVHSFEVLNEHPYIVYAGNLQGRGARESLATLAQGEAEENLRGRLENFAEDEAIVRLEAMKDEDHHLADEINETYARSKELTARLVTATGGTGAELAAQQAKNAEAEMLANAREWAVYRFGQILLSRAIEEHRTQNQNPLMRQAGELFQRLTGGSFIGVEEEFDGRDNPRLVGRRESGGTVPIEGMSKGTRDQLYLSLRLAYLREYAQKVEAVPFIGDDLLTSWDDKRASKGLQTLAATSSQIQPILFTHHARILELAQSALHDSLDVIELTEI